MRLNKLQNIKTRYVILFSALLLAVVLLGSAVTTVAWLAMNKDVDESTGGISAKVTPNLVISNSSSQIAGLTADGQNVSQVKMAVSEDKFNAATHYNEGEVLSNLKCLNIYEDVDKYTGLSSTATLIDLPTNDGKTYYIEYTAYVSATDAAIENSCLTVSLINMEKGDYDTLSYQACSVDFYLDSVSASNFKGTLNLAGLDARVNNGTEEKESLTISLPNDCIPKNTDGYITIVMHIYFDGALIVIDGGDERCFVNTQSVSANDVKFDILITDTALSD